MCLFDSVEWAAGMNQTLFYYTEYVYVLRFLRVQTSVKMYIQSWEISSKLVRQNLIEKNWGRWDAGFFLKFIWTIKQTVHTHARARTCTLALLLKKRKEKKLTAAILFYSLRGVCVCVCVCGLILHCLKYEN